MMAFILGFILGATIMWHVKENAKKEEATKPGSYKSVPWENNDDD